MARMNAATPRRIGLGQFLVVFMLAFGAAFSSGIAADVLVINQVQQGERMDLPLNGQTMGEVEGQYGSPASKHAPVGDPPITRWTYDRWSVYFEYDRVLYTVIHEGEVIEGVSEPIVEMAPEEETN